jgi:hypothetical protein
LKNYQATRPQLGLSFFLQWSLQDCGCGKVMSFDDLFQHDGVTKRRIEPLAAGPFLVNVSAPRRNLITSMGGSHEEASRSGICFSVD